ncbi:MAG: pyridoxamine 5'-phosphate oxidase family protein [Dehalococcoidia bacterium]
MVTWAQFEMESPEIARLARERFGATDLVLLGTIRRDGWPRISPIEYTFFDGDLVLGGMWQSKKFLDIIRDNRVTLHSTTSNKDGQEGDAKLYGRALPLAKEREEAYWQHIFELMNWRPSGPAHVYTVDIESAAYVRFDGDAMHWITWPGNEWRVRRDGD